MVMRLSRNGSRRLRIPDDNVRIRTGLNASLSRVQIKNLSRVRASHRYEFTRIDNARVNALLPHDRHAILDAVHAVRYLGEVVQAELLVRLVEGAIVAARRLQVIANVVEGGVILKKIFVYYHNENRTQHAINNVNDAMNIKLSNAFLNNYPHEHNQQKTKRTYIKHTQLIISTPPHLQCQRLEQRPRRFGVTPNRRTRHVVHGLLGLHVGQRAADGAGQCFAKHIDTLEARTRDGLGGRFAGHARHVNRAFGLVVSIQNTHMVGM